MCHLTALKLGSTSPEPQSFWGGRGGGLYFRAGEPQMMKNQFTTKSSEEPKQFGEIFEAHSFLGLFLGVKFFIRLFLLCTSKKNGFTTNWKVT